MVESNIKGLNEVVRNLNKELKKIEGKTLKGLIRGGIIVLRDVELTSPLTPVDLGNLRASRFLVTSKSGISYGSNPTFYSKRSKKGRMMKRRNALSLSSNHQSVLSEATGMAQSKGRPTVYLGFSANYAAPVHEMPTKRQSGNINWTRPGSGGKFFEKAIDRNINKIIKVVQKEVKVK